MATTETPQAAHPVQKMRGLWKARRKKPEAPCPEFCLNCGTKASKYCPECGQENTPHTVHLFDLLQDVWDEFVKADNKFFRTIIPLLFKPGIVTKQYVEGKRKRYLSPMSLYLTVSALFFFVLSQKPPHVKDSSKTFGQALSKMTVETKMKPGDKISATGKPKSSQALASPVFIMWRSIDWKALPDSAEKYQAVQDKVPEAKRDDWLQNWTSKRIIVFKGYTIPTFFEHLLDTLPKIMFVNMPIFALVLKFLYFRLRRPYVQHFVFSLHLFTVYFILVGVPLALSLVAVSFAAKVATPLVLAFFACMPLYLFLAMKTVYGQGIAKTLLKLFLLTQIYAFIQFFASTLVFFGIAATLAAYFLTYPIYPARFTLAGEPARR